MNAWKKPSNTLIKKKTQKLGMTPDKRVQVLQQRLQTMMIDLRSKLSAVTPPNIPNTAKVKVNASPARIP